MRNAPLTSTDQNQAAKLPPLPDPAPPLLPLPLPRFELEAASIPLASSKLLLDPLGALVTPPRSLIANKNGSSSSKRLSGREKLDLPPLRSHVPEPALPGRSPTPPAPMPKLEVDPCGVWARPPPRFSRDRYTWCVDDPAEADPDAELDPSPDTRL